MLHQQWKDQIESAYMVCCHATMPLHNYRDKDNAYRFVRAYLEEKYVSDDNSNEQIQFIRKVFSDALPTCCDESGDCSCGEQSD